MLEAVAQVPARSRHGRFELRPAVSRSPTPKRMYHRTLDAFFSHTKVASGCPTLPTALFLPALGVISFPGVGGRSVKPACRRMDSAANFRMRRHPGVDRADDSMGHFQVKPPTTRLRGPAVGSLLRDGRFPST